jgi:hypothetical protein
MLTDMLTDDPGMPEMACPKCGKEMPDFDGFGVLAHIAPMPDPCGYCSHPSIDGDVCGICGAKVPSGKRAHL